MTVVLPRASEANPDSYGNAVTCGGGFRLYAFRAVISERVTAFATSRIVVLARDFDALPLAGIDATGYSIATGLKGGAVYFVIDTFYNEALIHWAAESSVFLAYWHDLLAMHPGQLHLVLSSRKRYKEQIASQWGIAPGDIIWGGLPREAALASSITYFPPLFSLNDQGSPDIPVWRVLWAAFSERLRAAADVPSMPPWLPKGMLVLPRGKAENFADNERTEPVLDWLAAEIIAGRAGMDSSILYADLNKDMRDQVRAVNGARVIVTNYGSAFFFNGALARNATIFAISSLDQHLLYPGMAMLLDFIRKYNNVDIREQVLAPDGSANLLADVRNALKVEVFS